MKNKIFLVRLNLNKTLVSDKRLSFIFAKILEINENKITPNFYSFIDWKYWF